jgi:N-methylhydantoinase B/oxoprolinase/acetone carboxylase alpha subunit
LLELTVGGGGGYGVPAERDPEKIGEDLLAGFYGDESVREAYPAEVVELAQEARARRLAALRARSGKSRT